MKIIKNMLLVVPVLLFLSCSKNNSYLNYFNMLVLPDVYDWLIPFDSLKPSNMENINKIIFKADDLKITSTIKNGLIIERISYNNDNQLGESYLKTKCVYDSRRRLCEELNYFTENDLIDRILYEYSTNNQNIKRYSFDNLIYEYSFSKKKYKDSFLLNTKYMKTGYSREYEFINGQNTRLMLCKDKFDKEIEAVELENGKEKKYENYSIELKTNKVFPKRVFDVISYSENGKIKEYGFIIYQNGIPKKYKAMINEYDAQSNWMSINIFDEKGNKVDTYIQSIEYAK